MTEKELHEKYFHWMLDRVDNDAWSCEHYTKLLSYLDSVDYRYTLLMDSNRESDGISLRYVFGYENNISYAQIGSELDIYPCSVLEMMVALANRCETQIMHEPDEGYRTYIWFWTMIDSLGLLEMTDQKFNATQADNILNIFMDNKYEHNGKGGLFTVYGSARDMRTIEIWQQMNYYLNANDIN